ncbi:MAG TPA: LodA/GoxA family CTQ-dependent oxidase, partial [Rhodothermales bacterium]|nr:LodA/GoxA family CTQ-dependent oxidase [Rhodothermales bacterium]
YLDKATLINCLGGRFSPGIDMTFIVRQPGLWIQNWQQEGPFRINTQRLTYSQATKDTPFLTAGWFPLRGDGCPPYSPGVEPGDTSKFMALPWHTDYNSCATHTPAPNPQQNLTLYWSWPAQRPVAVYVASDVQNGQLGQQRFSVRGDGTATNQSSEVGRYQDRINIVKNWDKIGVVIQATAIEGEDLPSDFYLEVGSQLDDSGNAVIPWPNTIRDQTKPADG